MANTIIMSNTGKNPKETIQAIMKFGDTDLNGGFLAGINDFVQGKIGELNLELVPFEDNKKRDLFDTVLADTHFIIQEMGNSLEASGFILLPYYEQLATSYVNRLFAQEDFPGTDVVITLVFTMGDLIRTDDPDPEVLSLEQQPDCVNLAIEVYRIDEELAKQSMSEHIVTHIVPVSHGKT